MASASIWMPLYIGDYLADTMHLTTQEHGAYLLLIFAYWKRRGPLPDDDKSLAGIARLSLSDWPATRLVVAGFFKIASGWWHHGRIDRELKRAIQTQEAKRQGALKTNRKRWGLSLSDTLSESHSDVPSQSQSPSEVQGVHGGEIPVHTHTSKGGTGGNGEIAVQLQALVGKLYHKKAGDHWSQMEIYALVEVSKRPLALAEFNEIKLFLEGLPAREKKYFPQKASNLLNDWSGTLDRARTQKPTGNNSDSRQRAENITSIRLNA